VRTVLRRADDEYSGVEVCNGVAAFRGSAARRRLHGSAIDISDRKRGIFHAHEQSCAGLSLTKREAAGAGADRARKLDTQRVMPPSTMGISLQDRRFAPQPHPGKAVRSRTASMCGTPIRAGLIEA